MNVSIIGTGYVGLPTGVGLAELVHDVICIDKDENGRFVAMNALEKLIKNTKAHHILLSYSSSGRAAKKNCSI